MSIFFENFLTIKKGIRMKIVLYTYHGDVETTSYFMTQLEKQWEQSEKDSLESEKQITVVPTYFDMEKKTVNMTEDMIREHERLVLEGDTRFYFVTFNFAGIYGDDLWFLPKRGCEDASEYDADTDLSLENTKESAVNCVGKNGCEMEMSTDSFKDTIGQNTFETKGDTNDWELVVDAWKLTVVNILVDHPYHYHDFLAQQIEKRLDRYIQVCIDREHIAYMKRYFPMIKMGPFMPSGGTELIFCHGSEKAINEKFAKHIDRKDFMSEKKERSLVEVDDANNDGCKDLKNDGKEDAEEEKGNAWNKDWTARLYDIVFAATYVWPEYFNVFIDRNGPEYSAFYHAVLDEVLADHNKKLEDVMYRRLTEEVEEEISEDEMRMTLGHMQFLDYYVRYKNRERIVKLLAKAGFQIHIFGSGWQDMEWADVSHEEEEGTSNEGESAEKTENTKNSKERENRGDADDRSNLIFHPYVTSEECLDIFSKSKFVLNVLPSFHNGAHDRIFNAMLNGAICITDSNQFLDTILVDEENALLYNWEEPEKLIKKLKAYLDGEKKGVCTQIMRNGYELAKKHTWSERAKLLEPIFFGEMK